MKKQIYLLTLIVVTGVGASIIMYLLLQYGPGVYPDSVTYLESAQNILIGNGFFFDEKPVTHYPPGYSFLIAVVAFFQNGDILQSSRLLVALFFGINLVLFGYAVQICTEHSLAATVGSVLLFLFSTSVVIVHTTAQSESLFITFLFSAFILLSLHIKKPNLYLLTLASILTGCALLTRYVGITLLPPMMLAILIFGQPLSKQKFKDIGWLIGIVSLFLMAWLLRNILIGHTATNRSLTFHPVSFGHLNMLLNTIHLFILPIGIPNWMQISHIGLLTTFFSIGIMTLNRQNYLRRNSNSISVILPSIFMLFVFTYIPFLFISISFFDAHTPLDTRILLPALLTLTAATISLNWYVSLTLNQKYIWLMFVFFASLSISINGYLTTVKMIDIHRNGHGYTSRYWRESEIILYLASNQDNKKIYSNGSDVIRFLTDKKTTSIPHKISPFTKKLNSDYETERLQMIDECRTGEAVIIYFDAIRRWYLPSAKELETMERVSILRKFEDGAIYCK